jgi:hypothetical protein
MSTPALLVSWREIVLGFFPFLARFTIDPTPGAALKIKSANALIEIEGGAKGVARNGDFVARFCRDSLTGFLYVSSDKEAPYSWTLVPAAALPGPPTPADAGAAIVVSEGSERVTCG